MSFRFITCYLLLVVLTASCALKEASDLVMPSSPCKLFVEGYLSPGAPLQLSLVRTSTFQQNLSMQLVWNAKVELLLADTTLTLQNIFYKDKASGKLINYANPYVLPAVLPEDSIRLRIITENEQDTLYAVTKPVAPVKITGWTLTGQQLVLSCTQGTATHNRYYGVYLEYEQDGENKRKVEYYDHARSDEPTLTFRLALPPGKRAYRVILYRITPANYHFQRAVQQASRSNVDPFEAPIVLPTNVQGGQGIFTYTTQDTLYIP